MTTGVIQGRSIKLFASARDVTARADIADLGVNPRRHGAKGDDETDDTAAVTAAVAEAVSSGREMYWPPGTYVTTASIPDFHAVRHRGPGIVKRGSDLFAVQPGNGHTNRLYVTTTGDDDNDGLSAATAMASPNTATQALDTYGPTLNGTWRIVLGEGDYANFTVPQRLRSRNFIWIEGPAVSNAAGFDVDLTLKVQGQSGSFTVGETVTGGTSGATGAVVENRINAASQVTSLVVTVASGAFEDGDVLTGGTSGATATSNGARPVPLAWIDKAESGAATVGVNANNRQSLRLRDIGVKGAFERSIDVGRHSRYAANNVHLRGATRGLRANDFASYTLFGGVIEDCDIGIEELFLVNRGLSSVDAHDEAVLIRRCGRGLKGKENTVGKCEWASFEDCDVGLELHLFSGTNVSKCRFRRNAIDVVLNNSEIHGDQSVEWGTGADASTRRLLSLGNSSEVGLYGWTSDDAWETLRTGHRPLVTLHENFSEVELDGSVDGTSEKTIYDSGTVIKQGWYDIRGKRYTCHVIGTVRDDPLEAEARILLRSGTAFMAELRIPATTPNNSDFWAEFVVVCSADGNNQHAMGRLIIEGGAGDAIHAVRTRDMSNDRQVRIAGILGNVADRITFRTFTVWG